MSRTVTIEFERMPGVCAPVTLVFEKIGNITYCYYDCGSIYFRDWANCHPRDTFSWEIGMRLAAKRACPPETYRAFRRWMWLAKEQHKARKLILRGDIVTLPVMMATDMIITNTIAREFGRVKVRVT